MKKGNYLLYIIIKEIKMTFFKFQSMCNKKFPNVYDVVKLQYDRNKLISIQEYKDVGI